MKKLVKKSKTASAKTIDKPAKKRKVTSEASDEVQYEVRLYATGIQKWDEKKGCRVLGVKNGLLIFAHKKPRSPKLLRKAVPLERVIQYGGDDQQGWVHLMARQQIDRFIAVSEPVRQGKTVVFDLGDGVTTTVNIEADYEVIGLEE